MGWIDAYIFLSLKSNGCEGNEVILEEDVLDSVMVSGYIQVRVLAQRRRRGIVL